MIQEKWNLDNIPPKGDKDVADFADGLFEIAKADKDRLKKNDDFLSNYALYRGKAVNNLVRQKYRNLSSPVNLYFANVERTVSNITARNPVGEVVDLDGFQDGAEDIFTTKLKKWWKQTNQQKRTRKSAKTMEIYGIANEKPSWDKKNSRPLISDVDPFAFFPAPGRWEDLSTQAPFVVFVYLKFVTEIEKTYKVKDVVGDEAYELLGLVREEYTTTQKQRIGNYSDAMILSRDKGVSNKIERCLVKEIWVRDDSTKTITEKTPVLDEEGYQAVDEDGNPLIEKTTRKERIYPDGVRRIIIVKTKKGNIVLEDGPNPNINPNLDIELASTTYPWGRFPVYIVNSYDDMVSIWGFSAAEQVSDLIHKINLIVMKLVFYVLNVMEPPLIVQKHCGITRAMIEESIAKGGRLVLMPTTPNARIEFMRIPNLPATFFNVLDMIIKMLDRVYQIEDADRGQAPKGVIAASAIVALQERNQVLMKAKTSSIDALVENRSRWAIGLWQNFGTDEELVEVDDEPVPFVGTDYAGRKFSFVVESGSTTPRTSLQIQDQARGLYREGAIDRQALLEALNFPGWKQIIERVGEGQLGQAIQILIQAGLPEDYAMQLQQFLMQPQGGAGYTQTSVSKTAATGVPKSEQGV